MHSLMQQPHAYADYADAVAAMVAPAPAAAFFSFLDLKSFTAALMASSASMLGKKQQETYREQHAGA